MPDASCDFGRSEVPAGGLEELHRGPIFERRRVGKVDDDLSTRKHLGQAFARDCVDARVWRGGNCLMPLLLSLLYDLRPDEAGPADNHDLHDFTLAAWFRDNGD